MFASWQASLELSVASHPQEVAEETLCEMSAEISSLCFFHVLHADVYGFDARRAPAACGPHLAPPGLRPLPSPPLPSNPGATQHLLVRLQRGPGGLLRDRRPPERAVAASHLPRLPPSPLLAVRVGTLGNVLWFPSKWGEHPEYENSVGGFGGGMN